MPQSINLGVIDPTKIKENLLHEQVLVYALKNIKTSLLEVGLTYEVTIDQLNYQFKLTHDILKRKRTNAKGKYRYEVFQLSDNDCIGSGSYGTIFPVDKTLSITSDNKLFLKESNRVVKFQCKHYDDDDNASTSESRLKIKTNHEYDLTRKIPNRGAKEPVFINKSDGIESYIVMNKLPGKNLNSVLKEDDKSERLLTTLERLDLSLSVLRKLQAQIHDNEIIHRDLKPDNIMTDLTQGSLNILDLGLSKHANDRVYSEFCGALPYMAKEQYTNTHTTEITDSYAAGKVLAKIWKLNYRVRNLTPEQFQKLPKSRKKELLKETAMSDMTYFTNRFNSINDLNNENKNYIFSLIKSMTKAEPNERFDYVDAIKQFELIRIRTLIEANKIEDKNVILSIKLARANGSTARKALRALHRNNKIPTFNLYQMQEIITKNLAPLMDHPVVIEQFINSLDIAYFKGLTDKQSIISALNKINHTYNTQSKFLRFLHNSFYLNDISQFKVDNFEYSYLVTKTVRKMHAKLDTKLRKSYQDIDSYVASTGKFATLFKAKSITIKSVIKLIHDHNGCQDDSPLSKVKIHFKDTINEYIRDTYMFTNIYKKDRAASEMRVQNMHALLSLINNYQGTPDGLLTLVKSHLETVQHTSHNWLNNQFFRLFTRSQLVNDLNATISRLSPKY